MDWLRAAAAGGPDRPAVITPERTVTYGELDTAADSVSRVVSSAGIGPGGSVAFWGENTSATVAAIWGIPRSGARAVILPPGIPAAAAMELSRAAGARGLWGAGDDDLDLDRLLRPAHVSHPSHGAGPPDGAARYVVFTSGSQGDRRGVVITGEQIDASAEGSAGRLGTTSDDVWLAVLPLGHVGGLSIVWRQARAGAPVVLEDGFDPQRVAALLKGEVSVASLVPTMLRRVLAADPGPYAGLRAVLIGGGPAGSDLLERARAAGLPALQTYGMTETASQVATERPDGDDLGTAGPALHGVQVRAVDHDGRARRGPGTIEVRGPIVSASYLDGPACEPGGWFRTGDIGTVDDEGRVRVLGRADAVIVTGGENVHPSLVEQALLTHPAVTAARVFGEPDPEWGMVIVAEVVLASQVGTEELVDSIRSRLARHEVPKRIEVVERVSGTWKT